MNTKYTELYSLLPGPGNCVVQHIITQHIIQITHRLLIDTYNHRELSRCLNQMLHPDLKKPVIRTQLRLYRHKQLLGIGKANCNSFYLIVWQPRRKDMNIVSTFLLLTLYHIIPLQFCCAQFYNISDKSWNSEYSSGKWKYIKTVAVGVGLNLYI
jgi:hypothetical protein